MGGECVVGFHKHQQRASAHRQDCGYFLQAGSGSVGEGAGDGDGREGW
jgi:hypothetical protein